jgi:outer membrane receptor protein involved in Fe transport
VESGDHLPLIPERLLKAGLRFVPSERLTFGLDLIDSAGAFFRGDEGNLGAELEDYTIVNARMEYRLGDRASFFVNVDNLLDEEYATFGLFGDADEVLGDAFDDPAFLSPGAPRAAWAGVRVQF